MFGGEIRGPCRGGAAGRWPRTAGKLQCGRCPAWSSSRGDAAPMFWKEKSEFLFLASQNDLKFESSLFSQASYVGVEDVTVVLQPALRVYRQQLREAWKCTGFVKLRKVVLLGRSFFMASFLCDHFGKMCWWQGFINILVVLSWL